MRLFATRVEAGPRPNAIIVFSYLYGICDAHKEEPNMYECPDCGFADEFYGILFFKKWMIHRTLTNGIQVSDWSMERL